jgi:hypothetical protein
MPCWLLFCFRSNTQNAAPLGPKAACAGINPVMGFLHDSFASCRASPTSAFSNQQLACRRWLGPKTHGWLLCLHSMLASPALIRQSRADLVTCTGLPSWRSAQRCSCRSGGWRDRRVVGGSSLQPVYKCKAVGGMALRSSHKSLIYVIETVQKHERRACVKCTVAR